MASESPPSLTGGFIPITTWTSTEGMLSKKCGSGVSLRSMPRIMEEGLYVILHFFSGLGYYDGTLLQYSCLEHPMDGETW